MASLVLLSACGAGGSGQSTEPRPDDANGAKARQEFGTGTNVTAEPIAVAPGAMGPVNLTAEPIDDDQH